MVSGHDRHRVPRVDARCSQRVRQHVGAALCLREGERTALVDDRRPVGRAHRRETVDDRGRRSPVVQKHQHAEERVWPHRSEHARPQQLVHDEPRCLGCEPTRQALPGRHVNCGCPRLTIPQTRVLSRLPAGGQENLLGSEGWRRRRTAASSSGNAGNVSRAAQRQIELGAAARKRKSRGARPDSHAIGRTNPGFFERARMRNGSARANPGLLA